jgi:hypothetical protein
MFIWQSKLYTEKQLMKEITQLILYPSILLHITYLFLIVIILLKCNLIFKTFKSFKC